jgi:exodeoxyribonuclease III
MPLRILSYNILAGGEDRIPIIGNVIQKQQPDLVALMEARSRPNAEALAQRLGMSLTVGEATNINKDHVVWLSRLPVIHAENHRLPTLAKTLVEIEILWDEIPIGLFATHLKAGQNQESERHRVAEMEAILGLLHGRKNQLHALVGDLNTVHPTDHPNVTEYIAGLKAKGEQAPNPQFPREVIPLLLKAKYVDCYRTLHPITTGYTYKLPAPALRIDYIFASSSFAQHLYACDVVTEGDAERASDHLPIWAEFR